MAVQLPNYTSHPGKYLSLEHTVDTGDCQIFQFDERETAIMRRLLAVIPKYYWVWELDGPENTWSAGQVELWDQISSVIETLEEKLIMGCDTNAIIDALEKISVAASASASASGGGCNYILPDTVVPPGDANDGDIPQQIVPTGFDGTWAEYETHKCKAANLIADDFMSTLYGMATISGLVTGMSAGLAYMVILAVMTGTGPSLLASGILGIIALGIAAPWVIAGIVTACVALFALGGAGLGYLASVADAISADKENFVCELFNSDSVADAKNRMATLLDGYYDVGWSEVLRDLLDTITLSLLSTATLNVLFEDNDDVSAYSSGTIDCDNCLDACALYVLVGGTYDGTTLTSFMNNNIPYSTMNVDGYVCGKTVTLTTFSIVSGQPNTPNNQAYRIYDTNNNALYSSNALPTLPMTGVRNFVILDNVAPYTPFVMNVEFTEE